MRVLQVRRQRHLALESRRTDLARELGRQDLDHDLAREGPLRRNEEPTHPSSRELALNPVHVAEGGLQPIPERILHGPNVSPAASRGSVEPSVSALRDAVDAADARAA